MKPSKTAFKLYRKPAKKRHAKKRPAKRRDGGNPMIDKLLKLKYRINDAYRNGAPGLLPDKTDKDFVMGLINNIRKNEENPSKIQLEECNKIWREYA